MAQAPDYVIKALCNTLHWATVYCRNYTLGENVSIKQINEIMEAIHEVPNMLFRWDDNKIDEVKLHLGCFDSSKWGGAPNLVAHFEESLKSCKDEK